MGDTLKAVAPRGQPGSNMRMTTLGMLAMASLIALPTTAVASEPIAIAGAGPFAGTVAQDETDHHQFDNEPALGACLQVMADYTVSITWAPVTDSLTLSANGRTITGTNGFTAVGFQASYCTQFGISVSGTDVATLAAYAITVTRSIGGGGA